MIQQYDILDIYTSIKIKRMVVSHPYVGDIAATKHKKQPVRFTKADRAESSASFYRHTVYIAETHYEVGI